jgi:hypothetical protein
METTYINHFDSEFKCQILKYKLKSECVVWHQKLVTLKLSSYIIQSLVMLTFVLGYHKYMKKANFASLYKGSLKTGKECDIN